jgi:AraC-like DNA-binding protein
VLSGHYFKRIRDRRPILKASVRPNNGALQEHLFRHIVERFARMSDVIALAVPLGLSSPEEADDPPPNPGHPACAEYAGSDYCRESWQLHLAELRRRAETHWHKCDYGRLCGIVPVVCRDRCLAAVKLAAPASMPEEDFGRQVEILHLLVKDFVTTHVDFLGRLPHAELSAAEFSEPPSPGTEKVLEQLPSHPQVVRALQYIEEHLSDPKLTVAQVARELEMHPSYLSHLFADQVGRRMSRFITARRVELAKTLLATTDWQIKRIARDTGHANPNWFCYVFRVYTGLAPGGYRRKSRGPMTDPSTP